LVVRAPAGATWSMAGPFHSQSMEAWFAQIPGLKVVIPGTPADAKGLLKSAIRDPNPVIFLEQKYLYRRLKGPVPEGADVLVPLGEAAIARPGRDLTLVAYGTMAFKCLEAAAMLAEEGIEAEVVDLRTIVPWDKERVLDSVARTGRALVVTEAHHTAGFGAEIAATIAEEAFDQLDAPVRRLSGLDTPIPAHPVLEAEYLPDERKIAGAARELAAY
jgi:pyruvate/2-oxoglutarate/acetoin dehydrogenase E1 component